MPRMPADFPRIMLVLLALVLAIPSCRAGDPSPGAAAPVDYALVRGVNYVPSYAVNDVGIWRDFDPKTIDRELAFAESLKLNSIRLFLQIVVYERDRKKFLDDFDAFLEIADRRGLTVMPVLFGSCFGEEPFLESDRGGSPIRGSRV